MEDSTGRNPAGGGADHFRNREPYSTFGFRKGLDILFGSVSRVRCTIIPSRCIDGILLTMADSRTNNARNITASLKSRRDRASA
ncbi:MAG: hypothetical protein K6C09_08135 [Oscillospiraceae bacterium]|nr:hypothetical protein [Oscillospiraceae bacterium]